MPTIIPHLVVRKTSYGNIHNPNEVYKYNFIPQKSITLDQEEVGQLEIQDQRMIRKMIEQMKAHKMPRGKYQLRINHGNPKGLRSLGYFLNFLG